MSHSAFHSIALKAAFTNCNCECNEFLGGRGFTITAEKTYFVNSEMNDTEIQGLFEECDCVNMEFKNSNCLNLKIAKCSIRDIDKDGATGFDESAKDLEEIFK